MAPKRKSSPAPAPAPPQENSSSDEDSSPEQEEQAEAVPPPVSAQAMTSQGTNDHDNDEKDSDLEKESESESESEPPAKPTVVHHQPSESEEEEEEDDDDEEEEDGEEEEQETPIPASPITIRKPEIQPEKKLKLSAIARQVWSQEDKMVLLRALSQYHDKNGKLPEDYGHFLATISGSIGFPVTEQQVINKIRMLRESYTKKKKKRTDLKITKPHEKAVFDISAKLFEENNKLVKKGSKGAKGAVGTDPESDGEAGVGAGAGAGVRSNHYLRSMVEDLVKEQKLPPWFTAEYAIAHIGKGRVKNWEARIKSYTIDTMKLLARGESLKSDLITTLAEGMESD